MLDLRRGVVSATGPATFSKALGHPNLQGYPLSQLVVNPEP